MASHVLVSLIRMHILRLVACNKRALQNDVVGSLLNVTTLHAAEGFGVCIGCNKETRAYTILSSSSSVGSTDPTLFDFCWTQSSICVM